MGNPKSIFVIYGPTASGKSAFAHVLAQALGGVIINADAMQIYRELRVLTARPTAEEEAALPHRLYGSLSAAEPCSAGKWAALAQVAIDDTFAHGRTPILVGGTGLYLRSLMDGLSPIPDIASGFREQAAAEHAKLGGPAFHAALAERDPVMASRLKPGDTQRLIRAWEVLAQTGQSLAHWQTLPPTPFYAAERFTVLGIDIPRDILYARCDARFDQMLEQGALDEVRQLKALNLSTDLPAMRAVGVPELMAYLDGELTLEAAAEKARQATRNYAKRQLTWGRNQLPHRQLIAYDILNHPAQWQAFLAAMQAAKN